MSRLVKKTAHGPYKLGDKNICMCGLSSNQPFCDGSHQQTLDEDDKKTYVYSDDYTREEACVCKCDETCSCCQKNN